MKTYIYLLFFTLLIFTSCEKNFLDTNPTDQISASDATATTGNGFQILNGIHRDLYQRQEGGQPYAGIGGSYINLDVLGEDQVYNDRQAHLRTYNWEAPVENTNTNTNNASLDNRFHWIMYYKWIGNANVLINNIKNADGSEEEKNAILGQALTYRAFCHYQLVQIYGARYNPLGNNEQLGVPYKKNEIIENLPRNTVEEVYTEINKDLDAAILALTNYSRPNKSNLNSNVAKGIKARVALTMGDWNTAITMAQEARQGFTLMNADTYAKGFQINSEQISEIMWASHVQIDQHDTFSSFGGYMSRNGNTSAIRNNPRSINSLLYDKISDSDVRKKLWSTSGLHENLPNGVTISSNHKRFPYTNQKFISVSASDTRVDIPHMRAAEMFLIEAEAKAKSTSFSDTDAATVLFDLMRTRNTDYKLSSNTGQALIDEILIHRRIELWGEGFRFFDLKRQELPLDRTNANHLPNLIGNAIKIPANDSRWVWKIPIREINANKNLN